MRHLLPVLTEFENKLIARIWANPGFDMSSCWEAPGCGCIAQSVLEIVGERPIFGICETARDVFEEKTGVECMLQFGAAQSPKLINEITRAEAVWHVATRGAGWVLPQGGPRFPEERARIEKEMGR